MLSSIGLKRLLILYVVWCVTCFTLRVVYRKLASITLLILLGGFHSNAEYYCNSSEILSLQFIDISLPIYFYCV
jgi:hypothetical protein